MMPAGVLSLLEIATLILVGLALYAFVILPFFCNGCNVWKRELVAIFEKKRIKRDYKIKKAFEWMPSLLFHHVEHKSLCMPFWLYLFTIGGFLFYISR